jgi:L-lactate dehydrogenase complex protein LldF
MTDAAKHPSFPEAARTALADTQLRHNLGHATRTIRAKRAVVVSELDDWEQLREAGRALKERVVRHLDDYLIGLEEAVTPAEPSTGHATRTSATGSSATLSPPTEPTRSSRRSR